MVTSVQNVDSDGTKVYLQSVRTKCTKAAHFKLQIKRRIITYLFYISIITMVDDIISD